MTGSTANLGDEHRSFSPIRYGDHLTIPHLIYSYPVRASVVFWSVGNWANSIRVEVFHGEQRFVHGSAIEVPSPFYGARQCCDLNPKSVDFD
jgi:hypothetical protein